MKVTRVDNSGGRDCVLLFGAGPGQIPYIRHFCSKGYLVAVVDRNPLAPGIAEAEYPIPVSTFDYSCIREKILEYGLKGRIAAICCPATGRAYISAARCAAWLELPFPYEEAVMGILDKYRMWQALGKLNQTRRKCLNVAPKLVPKNIDFLPAVVKPRSGGGASRGVFYCDSAEQIAQAISSAASLSHDGEAIVESFCQGEEVKVAGFLENGRVQSSLIARRCFGPGVLGKPIGLAVGPPEIFRHNDESQELRDLIERFSRHVGLTDTPFNIDIIMDPVQPELIDFDLALGSLQLLMTQSSGIDVMELFSRLCMGQPLIENVHWWRGAAITYLWCQNVDTRGEELAKVCSEAAAGGVFSPDTSLSAGSVVSSLPIRVGAFLSTGKTLEAAARAGQKWLHRVASHFRNSSGGSAEVIFPSDSAWN